MTTGSQAQNNDAGIATRPMGDIVAGSGRKVWFEALISVGQIATAQAVYVGLVNKAGLGTGLTLSAASGTKNLNTIGTTAGQSLYGFWMHGDTPTNFDAVWANNITTALTPTTIAAPGTSASGGGLVLANVLNTTITQYPNAQNPLGYVPASNGSNPPGALIVTAAANQTINGAVYTPQQSLQFLGLPPSATAANGATGFIKLGIRYDGLQYLYYYVNGAQVAKILISALTNDQVSNFAGIVQIMTSTTTALTLNIGFERTAALIYP